MFSKIRRLVGDQSGAVTPLMAGTSIFLFTASLAAYDAASFASIKKEVETAAQMTADVMAHTNWAGFDEPTVRQRAQTLFDSKAPQYFTRTAFTTLYENTGSATLKVRGVDVTGNVKLTVAGTPPVRVISEAGLPGSGSSNTAIYVPIVFNVGNGIIGQGADAPLVQSKMTQAVDAIRKSLETEFRSDDIRLSFVPFNENVRIPSQTTPVTSSCYSTRLGQANKTDLETTLDQQATWPFTKLASCSVTNAPIALYPTSPKRTDYQDYVKTYLNSGKTEPNPWPKTAIGGCSNATLGLVWGYKMAADQINKDAEANKDKKTIVVLITDRLPDVRKERRTQSGQNVDQWVTREQKNETGDVCESPTATNKPTKDRSYDPAKALNAAFSYARSPSTTKGALGLADASIIGVNITGKSVGTLFSEADYKIDRRLSTESDYESLAKDVASAIRSLTVFTSPPIHKSSSLSTTASLPPKEPGTIVPK